MYCSSLCKIEEYSINISDVTRDYRYRDLPLAHKMRIANQRYLTVTLTSGCKVSAAALDSNGLINKVSGFSPKLFEAK